jgi:hypothetical protein
LLDIKRIGGRLPFWLEWDGLFGKREMILFSQISCLSYKSPKVVAHKVFGFTQYWKKLLKKQERVEDLLSKLQGSA